MRPVLYCRALTIAAPLIRCGGSQPATQANRTAATTQISAISARAGAGFPGGRVPAMLASQNPNRSRKYSRLFSTAHLIVLRSSGSARGAVAGEGGRKLSELYLLNNIANFQISR